MGAHHGGFCLGCCWALMSVLFVVGVMNLLWVAILGGVVLLEKISPVGINVARAAGALILLAGITLGGRPVMPVFASVRWAGLSRPWAA